MFSKKELLLFAFSLIKTFKRSFPVFLKSFWWLVAADITLKLFAPTLRPTVHPLLLLTAFSGITMLILYATILSIRASIEAKTLFYFAGQFKKVVGFAFLFTLFILSLNGILTLASGLSLGGWAFAPTRTIINLLVQSVLVPYFIIATLFFFDSSPADIVSPGRALICAAKGFAAYFPMFLAIALLYVPINALVGFLLSFTPDVFPMLARILINFFFTCAVSIIYLKMKHSNPKLFFKPGS